LQWTCLQLNVFSHLYLCTAAELIKEYHKEWNQELLRLMPSVIEPVGNIEPYDVGIVAAHLLVQEDPTAHYSAKYVLNGQDDIT
jgi:hypothetical protein